MPLIVVDAMDNAEPWRALAPDGVTPSTELSLAVDRSRTRPGSGSSARIVADTDALNHSCRRAFSKGYTFVTSNKTDPGPFGAGHNDRLRLSARASFPEPRFAASPNQFDRKRGLGPDPMTGSQEQVSLFGANFHHQPISVLFGEVPAIDAFPQSSSTIVATIPEMEPATVKIKVVTAGGAVRSDDDFRVSPWPVIDDFEGFSRDPSGQEFEIFGRHFVDEADDSVAVACSMMERNDGTTQQLSAARLRALCARRRPHHRCDQQRLGAGGE
jgi:hypothetical protein